MRRKAKLVPLLIISSFFVRSQDRIPQVVRGSIDRIEGFKSEYVPQRIIDVWLPEGYSRTVKYAVLYMHDGQMLFDPAQSWNRQSWDIDDVASVLMEGRNLRDFIVVGIWNGGQARHPEYFPQEPFERLSQVEKDTVTAQLQRVGRTSDVFRPRSDDYLKFIVRELKPFIDGRYSVHTDKGNTFIAGSSMGGLISLYALCEYPSVFGGAACLSTHWIGTFTADNNPVPDAFLAYLGRRLPNPKRHRIYFDCGDQTLDAFYPAIQKKVDGVMQRKGYSASSWQTRHFPGEDHSERSWGKRLHIPLTFLLGK